MKSVKNYRQRDLNKVGHPSRLFLVQNLLATGQQLVGAESRSDTLLDCCVEACRAVLPRNT